MSGRVSRAPAVEVQEFNGPSNGLIDRVSLTLQPWFHCIQMIMEISIVGHRLHGIGVDDSGQKPDFREACPMDLTEHRHCLAAFVVSR